MRPAVWLLALAVVSTACAGRQSSPATTPAVVATTASSSTTAIAAATTTTISRLEEVEAIVRELQQAWTKAVVENDGDAIRELHFNPNLAELEAEFAETPPATIVNPDGEVSVRVLSLIKDRPRCLVVDAEVDASSVFAGDKPEVIRFVLERRDPSGPWLISYRGEGYKCDGSHPFA